MWKFFTNTGAEKTETGESSGSPPLLSSPKTYVVYKPTSTSYRALRPDGTIAAEATDTGTTSGLKSVIDTIKAANVHIHFTEGTFSFLPAPVGNEAWAGIEDHVTFNSLHGMTFSGEGVDATIIEGDSGYVAGGDTEPLSFTRCDRGTIRDLSIRGMGSARQTSDALDFDGCSQWLVERVKIRASRGSGIVFDGKDNASYPANDNTIRDCVVEADAGQAINFSGIKILACDRNEIINPHVKGALLHGIQIVKASSSDPNQPNKKAKWNKVIGGSIDESGDDGINILSSDGNVVTGTIVTNSANGVAGSDGIRIDTLDAITADDNVIDANVCTDNQGTKTQRYGVNVQPVNAAEANRNLVKNNSVAGNLTKGINNTGTGTIVRSNPGHVTENKGTNNISSGNVSATVSHGLNQTPTLADIKVTPTTTLGAAAKFWISSPGSSNFTINVDVAPGQTITFAWQVEIL